MQLTKKQVEAVARLARLGLTDQEKKKFQKDLSAVLSFMEQLNEVKTGKARPTAQITGLENVSREDQAIPTSEELKKNLLNLSPNTQDGYLKVKSIL